MPRSNMGLHLSEPSLANLDSSRFCGLGIQVRGRTGTPQYIGYKTVQILEL